MKKILAIAVALFAFVAVASAQPRAIGVRAGYGGELSYQHSLGSNFAEFDLGWMVGGNQCSSISLAGIYNFILAGDGTFNFYAGPGAMLGMWTYKDSSKNSGGFNIALAGQLGVEYNIPSVPLQLSLDWRPAFWFLNSQGFYATGFGLGIRYRF